MGRKSTSKREKRYRQYMTGKRNVSGRQFLRLMQWANRSGYAELLQHGNRQMGMARRLISSLLSVPKGVIAINGDVHVNKSRSALAGRLNGLAYSSHANGLHHKAVDGVLPHVVKCFPHLHRKMIKTMPRGQAFARIVKLEIYPND